MKMGLLFATLAVNGCCNSSESAKDSSVTAQKGPQTNSYAKGERVQVIWKGKLYLAEIIAVVGANQYKIHYEGYGNDWDEVIGPDRIQGRAGGPVQAATAPAEPPPQADPNRMAADGLPVEIPPPGSKPPSVAEWNAVQREVRVKGSSAKGCETKMVREWLRVSCRETEGSLPPSAVTTTSSGGQQSFVGMFGTTASAVVQVVHGKQYRARYVWGRGQYFAASFLVVNWPNGAARPSIFFEDDDH